ncbi:hypothetical protein WJX81_002698 [Elliptochloris bilobata]|uniref:SBP-type domain-containing protein n=1 Tax=Elliptochloris bilobata TaxID=381761 RepID=A0AAW1RAY1_9CHLO
MQDLDQLIFAGDEAAWSLADWQWDPLALTAAPADGRSAKRARSGPASGAACASPFAAASTCQGCSACPVPALVAAAEGAAAPERGADLCQGAEEPAAGTALQPNSSSSGDAGAAAGSGPRCQVESCRRELAGLSAYHQKCRICEVHLKAPSLERMGLLQRFCQRCGRCHELGAFEAARRSCREQLAKHNARRRKAQGGGDGAAHATGGNPAVGAAGSDTPWAASSLVGALAQMGGAGAGADSGAPVAAGYQAAGLVVRLSVKLFNCTPAQLPSGLREQLCGWLNSTPACAEGFIRPGCLHLTFQAHVDAADAERVAAAGAAGAAAHLLAQDVREPDGLTALHFAALADDGGAIALRLMREAVPPGPAAGAGAWFAAAAPDGLTPADFAAHVGRGALNVAAARLLGSGLWSGFGSDVRGGGCGCGATCPVCSGPRGCRCGTRGFMCGFGVCGDGGANGGAPNGGDCGGHKGPRSNGAGCCSGGAQAPACCP